MHIGRGARLRLMVAAADHYNIDSEEDMQGARHTAGAAVVVVVVVANSCLVYIVVFVLCLCLVAVVVLLRLLLHVRRRQWWWHLAHGGNDGQLCRCRTLLPLPAGICDRHLQVPASSSSYFSASTPETLNMLLCVLLFFGPFPAKLSCIYNCSRS